MLAKSAVTACPRLRARFGLVLLLQVGCTQLLSVEAVDLPTIPPGATRVWF
jgi:hypothetical protein